MPTTTQLRLASAGFFCVGAVMVFVVAAAYLFLGRPPVAVADPPLPMEGFIAHKALHRRIYQEQMAVPGEGTETDLLSGADTYREQCAVCHGLPGKPTRVGSEMFPHAPQLWSSHRAGVVGVSDDPVSETLWKVKNGIRLSGMPAFEHTLTFAQMWQVSLLLHEADRPQSPAVMAKLAAGSGIQQ